MSHRTLWGRFRAGLEAFRRPDVLPTSGGQAEPGEISARESEPAPPAVAGGQGEATLASPQSSGALPTFDAHSPAPRPGVLSRPTELVDYFSYVLVYAPDEFPDEDGIDNPSAFQEMFEALNFFRHHIRTAEGREALDQCIRSLHNVYELYEQGSDFEAAHLLQDTERSFKAARKFIALSDA